MAFIPDPASPTGHYRSPEVLGPVAPGQIANRGPAPVPALQRLQGGTPVPVRTQAQGAVAPRAIPMPNVPVLKTAGPVPRAMLAGKRKRPENEDLRRPGVLPWLAAGTGAAGLGLARGMGSDAQFQDVADSFRQLRQPLPSNGDTTVLMQYLDSMGRASSLKPWGVPLSEFLPALRSQPWLTGAKPLLSEQALAGANWPESGGRLGRYADAIGATPARVGKLLNATGLRGFVTKGMEANSFTADTPEKYHGARAHYGAFSQGPVPAFMHELGAQPIQVTDMSLTGGKPMSYGDYFGPKFTKFVQSRTSGNLLPAEVDKRYLSHEGQMQLVRDFRASLTPAERAEQTRIESGDLARMRDVNGPKYQGIFDKAVRLRNALRDVGYTAGGAGVGGLAGHSLYRWLTPDDRETGLGASAATGAGMGLGGGAGWLFGTEAGRNALTRVLQRLGLKKSASPVGSLPRTSVAKPPRTTTVATAGPKLTGPVPTHASKPTPALKPMSEYPGAPTPVGWVPPWRAADYSRLVGKIPLPNRPAVGTGPAEAALAGMMYGGQVPGAWPTAATAAKIPQAIATRYPARPSAIRPPARPVATAPVPAVNARPTAATMPTGTASPTDAGLERVKRRMASLPAQPATAQPNRAPVKLTPTEQWRQDNWDKIAPYVPDMLENFDPVEMARQGWHKELTRLSPAAPALDWLIDKAVGPQPVKAGSVKRANPLFLQSIGRAVPWLGRALPRVAGWFGRGATGSAMGGAARAAAGAWPEGMGAAAWGSAARGAGAAASAATKAAPGAGAAIWPKGMSNVVPWWSRVANHGATRAAGRGLIGYGGGLGVDQMTDAAGWGDYKLRYILPGLAAGLGPAGNVVRNVAPRFGAMVGAAGTGVKNVSMPLGGMAAIPGAGAAVGRFMGERAADRFMTRLQENTGISMDTIRGWAPFFNENLDQLNNFVTTLKTKGLGAALREGWAGLTPDQQRWLVGGGLAALAGGGLMLSGHKGLGAAIGLGGAAAAGYGLLRQPGGYADTIRNFITQTTQDKAQQKDILDSFQRQIDADPGWRGKTPVQQQATVQSWIDEVMRHLQQPPQNVVPAAGGDATATVPAPSATPTPVPSA